MKEFLTKSGKRLPFIGLGTYPLQGEVLAEMIYEAYECGYRLIDTADDYRGEKGVGMSLALLSAQGVKREDVFIQTKISSNYSYSDDNLTGVFFNKYHKFSTRHSVAEVVREKVNASLEAIGTNYLDSLLIHLPYRDYYVEIWEELIKLKEEGVVRYIGVSNFCELNIEKLINKTGVCPEINEVYISPLGTKESLVAYCCEHNCLPMTYSPLMDLASRRLPVDPLRMLSGKYGKTPAQILLRWNIQRGCLPLPKTKSRSRLKENIEVFDFSIHPHDMAVVTALNVDFQYLVESKFCPGV